MRLVGAASTIFTLVLAFVISGSGQTTTAQRRADGQRHRDGQAIFRFDTFGDEQLWTSVLRMQEPIATVDPATALAVGLKVDVEALPPEIIAALRAGQVDLTSPAVTTELLRLNAVVGVKGTVSETGQLTGVGVTCALCHSTVDNSFAPGIGRRLDGWANRDLNVGAIVALSPALPDALKTELRTWGPGKYDPRHHLFDGTNLISLNSPSRPIVIPSIYGLKGVGFETFTGDGPISYWNSYVGVGQMGGHGIDVGGRHVRGDGLDLGPRTAEPYPEVLEGIPAFPPAYVNHGSAFQVQHDGQIAVPLGRGDLIDGDLPQVFQLRFAKSSLEVLLLNVLDHVPTDHQVLGNILDGHVPRQLQGVTLKGFGIADTGIGEADLDLPDGTTAETLHSGDRQDQPDPLAADRHGAETAKVLPSSNHVVRVANRAPIGFSGLFHHERHPTSGILCSHVAVASHPESTVK